MHRSMSALAGVPSGVSAAVLQPSAYEGDATGVIRGLGFEEEAAADGSGPMTVTVSIDSLARSMLTTGFQATNVALAIAEINRMLAWRLSDRAVLPDEEEAKKEMSYRQATKCTIFLSYTSNLISSGLRETIRFLVQHKLVDAIVTTAGGVEEDFIKCLAPTYLGDFKLKGKDLRAQGLNRLGNLLIPNKNYCMFEDWVSPILHAMTDEQEADPEVRWTPSKVIDRLGKEINHPDSVYYWCHKNGIPVFCPALTDGSLGDMIYFHSYKRPEFCIDVVQDIRRINDIAVRAAATGMCVFLKRQFHHLYGVYTFLPLFLFSPHHHFSPPSRIILGGGVVKHHTCNANLMRNGAEFSVYINTGQEFDGSDSGASPDEAVSWGKIRVDASPVKVCADATLVFPLIVTQTFLKELQRRREA